MSTYSSGQTTSTDVVTTSARCMMSWVTDFLEAVPLMVWWGWTGVRMMVVLVVLTLAVRLATAEYLESGGAEADGCENVDDDY